MSHLCLIDGTNMIRRAWAVADKQQDADGVEIGAAALFAKMVPKLLRRIADGRIPAPHTAILFDPPRDGTWRRAMYPGYKADRPPVEPELLAQIEMMREMCHMIGLAQACYETHEADDVIAALTMDARARKMRVSIISTDKDLMQLIRPGILQLNPISGAWYNVAAVMDKFGVPPDLLGDYLALAGDKTDGIPGAPGIGGIIAADILKAAGSLEAALSNPECTSRPSAQKALREHADRIRLSRKLVSLDTDDCPRPFAPTDVRTPDAFDAARIMAEYLQTRMMAPASTTNDLDLD